MMTEPRWVSKRAVLALHEEQLAEHGGSAGIRDESLLDSALARPQNTFTYLEGTDIFQLAASYAFGIARNHAFVDGNKRAALVVSITFLNLNGWDVEAEKTDVYSVFYGLAAGDVSAEQLAAWFAGHTVQL